MKCVVGKMACWWIRGVVLIPLLILFIHFMMNSTLYEQHQPFPSARTYKTHQPSPSARTYKTHQPFPSARTHKTRHKSYQHTFQLLTPQLPKCDCDVRAFIIIYTATDNVQERALIRSTWANMTEYHGVKFRIVFALGIPGSDRNEAIQKEIDQEIQDFGDILQYDFIDAYRNLSPKMILTIGWMKEHCPNVKYIMKVDDDVLVNIPFLAELFWQPVLFKGFYCRVAQKFAPIRNDTTFPYLLKYAVSVDEYADDFYPPFCIGIAYILGTEWLDKLYEAATSMSIPPFPLDDVFVTGILAKKSGIPHTAGQKPFVVLSKNMKDRALAYEYAHLKMEIRRHVWLLHWKSILTDAMA